MKTCNCDQHQVKPYRIVFVGTYEGMDKVECHAANIRAITKNAHRHQWKFRYPLLTPNEY